MIHLNVNNAYYGQEQWTSYFSSYALTSTKEQIFTVSVDDDLMVFPVFCSFFPSSQAYNAHLEKREQLIVYQSKILVFAPK